jgi:hypothetical protein
VDYYCGARDYLSRATQMLKVRDQASMFYAAFELRCGIEARMREYLIARQEASKKVSKGWKMADLHGQIAAKFKLGLQYARWAVHDEGTGELLVCFYYTPVTPQLKKLGQQLGDFLHVMKEYREPGDPWWTKFRDSLEEAAELLSLATSGVMLGPAMCRPGSKQAEMNLRLPPGTDVDALLKRCRGLNETKVLTHVSYPDSLPNPLEVQAVMWHQ